MCYNFVFRTLGVSERGTKFMEMQEQHEQEWATIT
jgi:hypothetical protein